MAPVAMHDDRAWLAGLRGGDPTVIESLREFVRAGLGRTLGRRGVSDADLDDFTQAAVVRILERLSSFKGESRFTTWALAVALRVAYTELRRRRWKDVSLDDLPRGIEPGPDASGSTPESAVARQDLLEALRRAIAERLTERQRTVVLGELAGVPQVVLAERLGSQLNAIYKLHHDARRKLRDALAAAGYPAEHVREILREASEE